MSAEAKRIHPLSGNSVDPQLVFILARQTAVRWRSAAVRLRTIKGSKPVKDAVAVEARLGIAQLQATAERLRPMSQSQLLAVRYEAEEVLVSIDEALGDLQVIAQRNEPSYESSVASATTLGARIVAKLLHTAGSFRRN